MFFVIFYFQQKSIFLQYPNLTFQFRIIINRYNINKRCQKGKLKKRKSYTKTTRKRNKKDPDLGAEKKLKFNKSTIAAEEPD